MTPTELQSLLSRRDFSRESEWIEFKHNNSEPEEIGEYLSALANAAALHSEPNAYLLWGIEDGTRQIVGTSFRPKTQKIGNEELESWLARLLSPRIDFRIHEIETGGKAVVVFQIPACLHTPIAWKEVAFIRVGSYKKKLKDYPEKQRALWSLLSRTSFENGVAQNDMSSNDVLGLIDYPAYFDLSGLKLPSNRKGILERLEAEKIIRPLS